MKKISIFAVFLATVGFTLGTLILLGPVRWLTDLARVRGWTEESEVALIRCVIVALVISAAFAAARLTGVVTRTAVRAVRIGLPSLAVLSAVSCVGVWFGLSQTGVAEESYVGSRFTFGSFPNEERLSSLANQGYSSVISLLHPAVVPFETRLIGEERRAAAAVGLEFIHVPMLPWVSDNAAARLQIEEIVNRGEGRYYVHCFLGKDRVRVVKHWVQDLDPAAAVESTRELAHHEARRRMYDRMHWQRGEVVFAGEDIFVTPHPAATEYVSYILAGSNGNVISLLDPDNETDRRWIEEERRTLEGNGMQLTVLPIPLEPYDGRRALEVVELARKMPGPKIVHAFLSVGSGKSPGAEAFIQALHSGLPPLPPALFNEPMARGPVDVIAPNVATGPRPQPSEFGLYLQRRGVREFVYLGNAEDEAATADRLFCEAEGLGWRAVSEPSILLELVARGGPWYLYGPELAVLRPLIAEAMGPAMPTSSVRATSGPS